MGRNSKRANAIQIILPEVISDSSGICIPISPPFDLSVHFSATPCREAISFSCEGSKITTPESSLFHEWDVLQDG